MHENVLVYFHDRKAVTSLGVGLAATPIALFLARAAICFTDGRATREEGGSRGFNLHRIILSKSDAFHYAEAMRESGPVFVVDSAEAAAAGGGGGGNEEDETSSRGANPFPLSL